jgi:ABC-2 type transport system permease protein
MSFIFLLTPFFLSLKNRVKKGKREEFLKVMFLVLMGLIFWGFIFFIFLKVLLYFKGIELLGDILTKKLLSMILLTFFSLLIFSNIITSLSTFYISDDLSLILILPASNDAIYLSRFINTVIQSSWMVLLFGLPIFLAYGLAYNSSYNFYIATILVIIPFIIISSGIGIIIGILLSLIFPARNTRNIFLFISILIGIGLYITFRFLQPEKLVNPDSFSTILEYFSNLKNPDSIFLPSYWATESLIPILYESQKFDIFYILLLWSTGLALLVIGSLLYDAIYNLGFSKAQESKKIKGRRGKIVDIIVNNVFFLLPLSTKGMITKDIKEFFRDNTQWSQLFLLIALIIVYLYNYSVLPLNKSPIPTFYMQNIISFLNMELAGFVLAAISVRFVYPIISREGNSFWIIKNSPIHLKEFILSKFIVSILPLLIIGEILIIVSNYLLHVTSFMMFLSTITVFFITFGIVSLGICIGGIYPKFHANNISQISSGFGGIIYMIVSMIFIGIIVVLEAWPVYIIFTSKFRNIPIYSPYLIGIFIDFLLILLISVFTIIIPIKIAIKKISIMEYN